MNKIKLRNLIIIIAIVVLIGFTALVNFFTDFLWFKEMNYVGVFFKKLLTQSEIGIPIFFILASLCYIYLLRLKKNYYSKVIQVVSDHKISEKKLNLMGMGLSGIFALLVTANVVGNLWFQILQFINSTDFNIIDPIFHKDISFYIFKLEFINNLNNSLISIIIGFAIIIFVYYLLLLAARKPHIFDNSGTNESYETNNPKFGGPFGQMFGNIGGNTSPFPPRAKSSLDKTNMNRLISLASGQIKVLGVLLFLMIGLHFYLNQFTLLYSGSSGVVYGAGYTDINITLWVYRLLVLLSIAGAVVFVLALQKHKYKRILLIPVVMIGVLILGLVLSGSIQSLVVSPDEINKEYAYLENNINFTRSAYDLQDISISSFQANSQLSADDIANNMETISNIRINDFEPAEKFYNQTQSIRLYYKFNDVDVDRYTINGEYTQVFLSAREIDESATTDQWLTNHLKYTHGYGITLSRVDKVTESGQPDMLIDSIPPVSDVKEINITRPEIYFGETTENYIIVNTDEQEFDYPSGDNNVYTTYQGNAGIKLNFINRLLFSVRESSIKLLVSTNINNDSRIIINRNIMDRIQKIAPFLSYDQDPYIVTVNGGLYWIIDAYTSSSYYPYSEPYAEDSSINYVRNSIKVVVDAYNGDTNYYIVDEEDPIAITLQKIYPSLFKNFEDMPQELQSHIRYPNTLFSIQAAVYGKYHMTDVNVFYQNEDAWNIATEVYGTETVTMTPRYYIMKLPNEQEAEFINSVPYTPSGKYNMTALLVARNDGENYGDIILYQLPKDRIIYGPQQIESQINQNTEIARDFTLWSSAGSTYSRGNLFVIPIDNSLMYVEPIYLESSSSSLPEVKRVIIYYNERIAYAETLAAALDEMFGDGIGALLEGGTYVPSEDGTTDQPADTETEKSFEEIAELANQAYENAIAAQQSGDWAAYGRYLDQLKQYLAQLVPEETTNQNNTEVNDLGETEINDNTILDQNIVQ